MTGEFEQIARFRARAARGSASVPLGIGDDAALLRPQPGFDVAFASDLSIEDVHFRLDWTTPELLGRKAIAVSLSDLAAMGARPRAALLGIAVPGRLGDGFLDRLFAGALEIADRFGVEIAGGDLSSSHGPLAIDSVLLGEVREGGALLRGGARGGQDLWVSGRLGASAAGLGLLAGGARLDTASGRDVEAILAHLAPEPRVELGVRLAETGLATAAIDLSDGLSSDVRHLCAESGVGVLIDQHALPAFDSMEDAIHGGEQYELVFAARPADRERVLALGRELELPLTRVGAFAGVGVRIGSGGREDPLEPRGWDHFDPRRSDP